MNEPRTSRKHYVKKLRACKSHFRMTEDGAAHATGVVPGNFGENLGLFTK